MNEKEQQEYLEEYKKEKEKGVLFFPDILFKDSVVSLIVFFILVALAYFFGAPLESKANPANTSFTPRPEWYFLFLFQLLKYFPGRLEVIGVIVIPTLVLLSLFFLPLIDRSSKRHFLNRLPVTAITFIMVVGILGLTISALQEAPPPSANTEGDIVANLYAKNCSGCHGGSILIKAGINLHEIISKGNHEGMPGWSADLTSDQIDALAGFITSPNGNQLFNQHCSSCHNVEELIQESPLKLRQALENGTDFPPHLGKGVPDWSTSMSSANRISLLNFLVAPDGQRLFDTNCSTCHGSSISFSGSDDELRKLISQGGKHLNMPGWKEKLTSEQIDQLARYVVNPAVEVQSKDVFQQLCGSCHGQRIPKAESIESARQIIESGGPHRTMPVWGEVLTPEQLDALVSFTRQSTKGNSIVAGQQLFSKNCAQCHGSLGEGGINPTKPGDIIAPISSAEFLKTRDDFTLKAVISQGQPNFGMSPFETSNGGSLTEEDIDAIVAYLRSWEAKPPVDMPPDLVVPVFNKAPAQIYSLVCAKCHGADGEGGNGPAFQGVDFQNQRTDQQLFDVISKGKDATAMIGWGEILSVEQINKLVGMIRSFKKSTPSTEVGSAAPTFSSNILPIFKEKCVMCHGASGGWDGSNYKSVMESGENAPVILANNPQGSLLVQKLIGKQTIGGSMPPGNPLSQAEIDAIVSWITAGAMDN